MGGYFGEAILPFMNNFELSSGGLVSHFCRCFFSSLRNRNVPHFISINVLSIIKLRLKLDELRIIVNIMGINIS